MKRCLKKLIKYVTIFTLMSVIVIRAYSEELPDIGIDSENYNLPDSVTEILDENNISADNVDSNSLDLISIISFITDEIKKYVESPLKLLLSLFAIILLSSLAKVISDTACSKVNTTFSLVCAVSGATAVTVCVSKAVTYTSTTLDSGRVFLSSFIPAFAGLVSSAGKMTSAVALNTVIMTGAQLYIQLAVNILMPVTMCIMALTLTGCTENGELNILSIADNIKKAVIWILGIVMTVFVALLAIQSFITAGADSVGLKAMKFTVSNSVPFIGGAVSDALAVMQGGMKMIRNNFGVFGIIAGALLILPSLLSAFLYKTALIVGGCLSDLFSLKTLSVVIKSAEGVMSIIIAMLVCFMLMVVISVSLMIFVAGEVL